MPRVSAAARPAIGTMSIGPKRDLRGARRTSKKTAASTAAAMAKPSNWKYRTRPSSVLAGPDVSQPVTMIQPIMSRAAAMPIRATRPAARERPHMPIPMVTSMTPTARNGGSRANAEAPRAM